MSCCSSFRNRARETLAFEPNRPARYQRITFSTGTTNTSTTGNPTMSERMNPLIPLSFAMKPSSLKARPEPTWLLGLKYLCRFSQD